MYTSKQKDSKSKTTFDLMVELNIAIRQVNRSPTSHKIALNTANFLAFCEHRDEDHLASLITNLQSGDYDHVRAMDIFRANEVID